MACSVKPCALLAEVLVRGGTSRRFDLILGIVILGECSFLIESGSTALSCERLFGSRPPTKSARATGTSGRPLQKSAPTLARATRSSRSSGEIPDAPSGWTGFLLAEPLAQVAVLTGSFIAGISLKQRETNRVPVSLPQNIALGGWQKNGTSAGLTSTRFFVELLKILRQRWRTARWDLTWREG